MLSIDSEYNLLDKNGNVYILRSLCIDDASGIWLESISRLNPGFTEVSRIPKGQSSLIDIVNSQSNSHIWLAVASQADPQEHIANIHIGPIDYHHRMTFFGRFIFEPYRGLGLGAAISKSVIKYCFKELNLRKVKAGNIGNNIAARKSNENAGLMLDYVEKNSYFHDGDYHDLYVYSAFNNSSII